MDHLKQCTKCKQWKPESCYYKQGGNRPGLRSRCVDCMREDSHTDSYQAAQREYWGSEKGQAARKRYQASDARKEAKKRWEASEKAREYERSESRKAYRYTYNRSESRKESARRYEQSERGKIKRRRIEQRYSIRNPEKRMAKYAVRGLVKRGIIPPVASLSCVKCKNQAAHYHHYLGYAKEHWLDVEPLCEKCHYAEHH